MQRSIDAMPKIAPANNPKAASLPGSVVAVDAKSQVGECGVC